MNSLNIPWMPTYILVRMMTECWTLNVNLFPFAVSIRHNVVHVVLPLYPISMIIRDASAVVLICSTRSSATTHLEEFFELLYNNHIQTISFVTLLHFAFSFISSVGKAENISFSLSIGIVRKPTNVSYGGLLGADGCAL